MTADAKQQQVPATVMMTFLRPFGAAWDVSYDRCHGDLPVSKEWQRVPTLLSTTETLELERSLGSMLS